MICRVHGFLYSFFHSGDEAVDVLIQERLDSAVSNMRFFVSSAIVPFSFWLPNGNLSRLF